MTRDAGSRARHAPRDVSEDDREQGQIAVLWAVLSVALLVLGGLIYDGGNVLAARRSAHNLASQAARAGAQGFDTDAILAGRATLDPQAATAAGEAFLAARDSTGQVTATPAAITVTVTIEQPTPLLALVGIDSRRVTGTASAVLARQPTGGTP